MKTKCLSSLLVVLLGLQTFNEDISLLNVNADETKSYVVADFTKANDNWSVLTVDNYGFKQENGQLTLTSSDDGYDAAANGAYLTFKVQADNGNNIDELKLSCVGNRLGSFGKAAGASENTVSFKPFISTTSTFTDTPIEEIILPTSTECYNLDYDFTSHLTENTSTYYVKLWFGSSVAGAGFYYDWFQLGSVTITGKESKITNNETYVSADYTITNDNWQLTTFDNYGFKQENGQLTLVNEGYDAAANGAWLTYKIDTKTGSNIDELKLSCVGNRLGSFGKAVGASENTVSFKPFISTTSTLTDTPIEEVILPTIDPCYNLDYDFTPYLTENTSTYYVKLWFGSSVAGAGFYYDWFQLGSVTITGKESGSKEGPTIIDASNATLTLEKNEFEETGSEIKPVVTVKLDEKTLIENQDYYVTYQNNVEPGKGKVNVTFINDYTGKASIDFTIKALPISYDDANYKVNKYVPDKYDFVDYWGGIGDIDVEYGDGITSFSHISSLVPLKGQNIKFTTSLQLLSKNADNVDGWVTYSFSSKPGEQTNDKTFPYYGGNANGYFLHITNYSTQENLNTVEVQFVKSVNGETTTIDTFFVNNLITNTGILKNDEIIFTLNLVKNENGTWTLSFINKDTNEIIDSKTYDYLNERLFINQNGQTYLSSAIYEGAGCDGNHWDHRGLKVYDMDVFTLDATNAKVSLSQTEFVYEEGKAYKPEVNVTINGEKLVKDVDYYLEYRDNKAVGTGKVVVNFINQYAGNKMMEATFDIVKKEEVDEPSVDPSSEPSMEPSVSPSETTSSTEDEKPNNNKKGCKGETATTGFILLTLIGALLNKKRKN